MQNEKSPKTEEEDQPFVEGIDYYFEDGLMVLTRRYLLNRGYCCQNNCRNCPYGFEAEVKVRVKR